MSDTRPDRIQLIVTADGSPARKELAETQQAVQLLYAEKNKLLTLEKNERALREMAKKDGRVEDERKWAEALAGTRKRLGEVREAITANEEAQNALRKSIGVTGLSINELKARALALRAELRSGLFNEEELALREGELLDINARMKSLTGTAEMQMRVWERYRNTLTLTQMTVQELGLEQKRLQAIIENPDTSQEVYAETAQQLAVVKDRAEQLTNANRIAAEAWEINRKEVSLMEMSVEQLGLEQKRLQAILANPKTGAEERARTASELALVTDRTQQLTNANRIAADAWEVQRKSVALMDATLEQLGLEEKRLQAIMASPQTGNAERAEAARLLGLVKDRQEQLTSTNRAAADAWERERKSIALVDMTMEQLAKEATRLKASLEKAKPDTIEWKNYRKELDAVEKRQATLNTGMGAFGRTWNAIKGQVVGAMGVLGAMFAGSALFTGLQNWVKGSAKLSDELANVQKATGKTREEVQALNSDFGKLNTRTANADLRQIAVGLGQAGEEVSAAAVGAIDKINVALGDEFGQGAKEITSTLSVLRNNLSDIKSGNYGNDVMNIGNALNVLGANGLATAPVVSDIANRVAGVARTFNIASGEILGLAASFQELGINQERGSTAYIKILQRMAAEPDKFRKVVKAAGMDVAKFNSDLENNMQDAFVTVATAAKTAGTSNTAFGKILKELDADGAGVSELLSKIGSNQELLAAKSKLATDALKSQDSILAEFNTRNNTLGANLDMIGKALAGAFVNSSVMAGIEKLVNWVGDLVGVNKVLSESMETERVQLQMTYSEILSYNVGAEERTKLIQKLQAQYPSFLANMEAEKVSNEELSTAVKLVNDQLVNKIILQRKDEEIKAQAETQADRRMQIQEQEALVRERMVKLAEKYNLEYAKGVPLMEQARDIQRQIEDIRARSNSTGGGVALDPVARFGKAIGELSTMQSFLNTEQSIGNKLAEERNKLWVEYNGTVDPLAAIDAQAAALQRVNDQLRQLGEQLAVAQDQGEEKRIQGKINALLKEKAELEKSIAEGRPVVDTNTGGTGLSEQDAKEFEAKRKAAVEGMEKIRQDLADIRMEMLRDGMTAGARELDDVDAKYEKLREEILKNEAATEADVDALDAAYVAARKAVRDKQHTLRLEEERKKAEELAKAQQEGRDQLYLDTLAPEDQDVAKLLQEFDAKAAVFAAGSEELLSLTQLYEAKITAVHEKYAKERTEIARAERIKKIENYVNSAQAVGAAVTGLQSILAASAAANGKSAAEQSEFQRMLALTQIGIASAVGVAEAIKMGIGSGPFPANLAAIATGVGAVLSGIASAMGILNATPPTPAPPGGGGSTALNVVPLGKEGGMGQGDTFKNAKAGVLEGPSHNDGGLGVYNEKTGRRVAEFEGGEAYMVLSKKFTDLNRDQLGALMAASRNGQRIQISGSREPLPRPSPMRVEQAMQPSYAAGGMVHTRGTALVNMAAPSGDGKGQGVTYSAGTGKRDGGNGTPEWAAAMLEKMGEMVKAQQAYPTNVKATVQLGPVKDREEARYANVKKRNTFMRA